MFGMTLSELNVSGKKLWVNLATAIIVVLVTGSTRFLLEEVKNNLKWQRGKGHDARTRVLTHSDSRLSNLEGARGLTACEYISQYEVRPIYSVF